jgi:hypothetical protein
MNLRIETQQNGKEAIVLISGDLAGRGVAELEEFCRKTDGPISLDLDDLRLIETDGLELIRELVSQGVKLLRVSPYYLLLLGFADE